MKHIIKIRDFKLNEELDKEEIELLEIGDWVVMKNKAKGNIKEFVESNIGQLVLFRSGSESNLCVKFENIPPDISVYFTDDGIRYFPSKRVRFFSKDREDVEAYLTSKKYNL